MAKSWGEIAESRQGRETAAAANACRFLVDAVTTALLVKQGRGFVALPGTNAGPGMRLYHRRSIRIILWFVIATVPTGARAQLRISAPIHHDPSEIDSIWTNPAVSGHLENRPTTTAKFFGDRAVRQASSLSPDDQPIDALQNAWGMSKAKHVQVGIRFLFVDAKTREAIYAMIPKSSIRQLSTSPVPPDDGNLEAFADTLRVSQRLTTYSRCTASTVSDQVGAQIFEAIDKSAESEMTSSPSIMLLDGESGDLNNAIQRPFVVDIQLVQGAVQPIVRVMEDGVRIRMRAALSPKTESGKQPIHLSAEFVSNQVLEIKSDQIFGLKDEPLQIQVPLYDTKHVMLAQELFEGNSLLVDLHVAKTEAVNTESERDQSLLTKLPLVGERFRKDPIDPTVDRYVMVLVRPAVVAK